MAWIGARAGTGRLNPAGEQSLFNLGGRASRCGVIATVCYNGSLKHVSNFPHQPA